MKTLAEVIDCVKFCTLNDVCDGCPSGQIFATCGIDDEVLHYLQQLQNLKMARKNFNPDATRTY